VGGATGDDTSGVKINITSEGRGGEGRGGEGTESKVSSDKKEVMLAVWYNEGALWVHLLQARDLGKTEGKVYAKTYLLPYGQSSKQKSETVASVSETHFNSTMSVCRS